MVVLDAGCRCSDMMEIGCRSSDVKVLITWWRCREEEMVAKNSERVVGVTVMEVLRHRVLETSSRHSDMEVLRRRGVVI